MPIYIDQLNREVTIPQYPQRIVSLVPSQTELLADLGLHKEVTGITKFCVHPEEWFRNKTRIGGTKTVNTDLVRSLQPDLIIANKEENVKEQVMALEQIAPVWVSDVNTVADALEMIGSIGQITGKTAAAGTLIAQIKKDFSELAAAKKSTPPYRTAYLVWKDPYMAAGGDTFISDVLYRGGFENALSDFTRYPSISIETLTEKNIGLLLLSSEPYPFKQKQVDELQLQLPQVKIKLVDGEMFSWYGSRLKHAAGYIRSVWASCGE